MPIPEPSCLVYSESLSPRLAYIVDVLWNQQAAVTSDVEKFLAFEGDKIQYTPERIWPNILHLQPIGLLSSCEIVTYSITVEEWQSLPIFFLGNGDIPFDWLAASFYLLSRYEEYLPYQPDQYSRFPATASLAHQFDFLQLPLVQVWTARVRENFQLYSLPAMPEEPEIQVTFDMDELFQYRYLPWKKGIMRLAGNMLKLAVDSIVTQVQVVLGRSIDPYDRWQDSWPLLEAIPKKPGFFFSGANRNRGHDRQLSIKHPAVKKIFQQCEEKGFIGWHPSWAASHETILLPVELKRLQEIAKYPIVRSRYHYLRFQLPESYRQLIELGIRHEYSMGYGNCNGFRASYADPYPWFDLSINQVTDLMVHPFFYMDTVSVFQQKESPDTALNFIQHTKSICRGVVREIQLVFHPHTLVEKGWRDLLRNILQSMVTQHPHQ
jgi:hypothetical protein